MSIVRILRTSLSIFTILILSTSMVNAAALTTIFATNNSFAGNTFDVSNIGTSSITINSFEVNLSSGSTPAIKTINVYTTPGTSVGVENNAASWTLLGSDTNVISNGTDVATPVNVGGLVIAPGQSFGIYIDFSNYNSGDALLYTNGGPTVYGDGTLQITTNTGQANPAFSGSFTFREWNGTVIYTAGIVVPAVPLPIPTLSEWALIFLIISLGIVGLNFTRRRSL